MAKLRIFPERIIDNISKMNEYCKKYNKEWTFVTKVLGGYKPVLEKILQPDVILGTHSIGDSRVSSLKTIKKINSNLRSFAIN